MVKKNTEYKGIQKKLVAAIAMVLVASIMVVTSSYAWFTLSTAPEVTGIRTSVGSNGNLEIALLTDGLANITNTDSNTPFPLANTYWGNLVDLSSEQYHLDDITLMPAALTVGEKSPGSVSYATVTVEGDTKKYFANKDGGRLDFGSGLYLTPDDGLTPEQATILAANGVEETRVNPTYGWNTLDSLIKVPVYGADGRINDFNSNSSFGVYDDTENGFVENRVNTGVRAVGVTSNLSVAELMLRNARKDVSNARGTALNGAINSLTIDAVKIAEIAIKDELGQAFTETDVRNLRTAEQNLRVIVDALEDAIYKSVIALGVSQSKTLTKEDITIDVANKTITAGDLDWVSTEEGNSFDHSKYQTMLAEAKGSVDTMRASLDNASALIKALEDDEKELNYANLRDAATAIMNPDTVLIEGKKIGDYASKGELVSAVSSNLSAGVDVTIQDGIYVEIAKFVGNYTATALMTVDAESFVAGMGTVTAKANMTTDASEPANGWYLNAAYAWLTGLKAGNVTSEAKLLSDLYAYTIDLAFRTNAANSSLKLQTDAANRVADSEVTQGSGSYMEFTAGHPDFTIEQMANLMSNIRVVFFDTNGTILAVAALDVASDKNVPMMDEATNQPLYYAVTNGVVDYNTTTTTETDYPVYVQATDANGAKLYEDALGNLTTTETDKPVYDVPHYTVVDATTKTIRAKLELYNFTVTANGSVEPGEKMDTDNQIITALEQNVAKAVSAMVYLDGNKVQNKDVAIGGSSMTGKLNLQFASTATLTPMDYDFGERLAKPTVSISGNTLTINKVDKATNYDVFVYGKKVGSVDAGSGDTTTYGIPTSIAGVPAGTYEVTVVATATGYVNSNASDPVNVTLVEHTGA